MGSTTTYTLRLSKEDAAKVSALTKRLPGLHRAAILRTLLLEQLNRDLDDQVASVLKMIQGNGEDLNAKDPEPHNRIQKLNRKQKNRRN